jgi:2-iminobutanoate/2-iminopropanoate deaminase
VKLRAIIPALVLCFLSVQFSCSPTNNGDKGKVKNQKDTLEPAQSQTIKTMSHQIIQTESAPAPIGPYSQARACNGFLTVSGQIAIDPLSGEMQQSSIEAETLQVMKNLQHVVEAAGYTMSDILKTTIFLSDMEYFAEVNKVYAGFFSDVFPARETVAVKGLPKNARVEISCIACAPNP